MMVKMKKMMKTDEKKMSFNELWRRNDGENYT